MNNLQFSLEIRSGIDLVKLVMLKPDHEPRNLKIWGFI